MDNAQAYQRAGLVTSEELGLIKRVDRQPRAKTESLLLSDGQTYALLYLRLLKKLNRVDTMQWILVLITDALAGAFMRSGCFVLLTDNGPSIAQTMRNAFRYLPELLRRILSCLMDRYFGTPHLYGCDPIHVSHCNALERWRARMSFSSSKLHNC